MDCLVVSRDVGGQAAWSGSIQNYTGYQFISGAELVDKFRQHLAQYPVSLHEGEEVRRVVPDRGRFRVKSDRDLYRARSAIMCSGRVTRTLGVPGEEDFLGRGVTYCAICDAPLFSGMDVAVIGGGNSGLDAVLQLTNIAGTVYLVEVASRLQADVVLAAKARRRSNVKILLGSRVQRILGEEVVQAIEIRDQEGTRRLRVQGVFVEIGSVPASGPAEGVAVSDHGEIQVNCWCETSIPGLYAAGDVTDVPAKQIVVAAGEGAKASLAAFSYLSRQPLTQVADSGG
jgi:alkyl hydroperoxide reductase subunit F